MSHLRNRGVSQAGRDGAAVATTSGRSIGVLYQLSVLFRGKRRVTIARRHLRIDWPIMRRLLRVSGNRLGQYVVGMASWVSLVRINASFGSAAVTGYTLAVRIITFVLMPSWGIACSAATLLAQNLGAKQPRRAERAVCLGGTDNMTCLTVGGIIPFAGSPLFVSPTTWT